MRCEHCGFDWPCACDAEADREAASERRWRVGLLALLAAPFLAWLALVWIVR